MTIARMLFTHHRLDPIALLFVFGFITVASGCKDQIPTSSASEPRQAALQDGDPPGRDDRVRNLLQQFDISNPQQDLNAFLAGGPPKDGIPALTDPIRNKAAEALFPENIDRVAVVAIGNEAVAYPIGILNWHEIANDTVGGVPVAVIYCPLCDSVSVVDRRITRNPDQPEDIVILEFGVSGLLHNSNVVMYDRNTDGLWSQVLMKSMTGPFAGRDLRHLPVRMMSFEDFKRAHPTGEVLSLRTGHQRDYHRNPYVEYFADPDAVFHEFEYDKRLPPKELGLGIIFANGHTLFVSGKAFAAEEPLTVRHDGANVVVRITRAGFFVEQQPTDARVVQTFYHSWAAFHPRTAIFGQPGPATTQPSTQPSRRDS